MCPPLSSLRTGISRFAVENRTGSSSSRLDNPTDTDNRRAVDRDVSGRVDGDFGDRHTPSLGYDNPRAPRSAACFLRLLSFTTVTRGKVKTTVFEVTGETPDFMEFFFKYFIFLSIYIYIYNFFYFFTFFWIFWGGFFLQSLIKRSSEKPATVNAETKQ